MKLEDIVITEEDYRRLEWLIETSRKLHRRDSDRLDGLEEELERAVVVQSDEVPPDVVTMNSRVRVVDLENGSEAVYRIVFPSEANAADNRISVLAPMGTALLGHQAGATVEWRAPSGPRRFRILEVEYQPEGARMAAEAEEVGLAA